MSESAASGNCQGSLSECFNHNKIQGFSNNQQIDPQDFNNMLGSVSSDLDKIWRTPLDASRGGYDTPFWTGNTPEHPNRNINQIVCIANKCSQQSSVNFVAQGMYGADAGEPPSLGHLEMILWKELKYHHMPSDNDYYWYDYGYKYKTNRKASLSQ